ncbi:MAG: alpha,alpha-trehalase TreF [Sphingomonas sp.]|uniref:alpha,alpha-trehalase TreF n=1 Tax=Sphingomonas sp. TaxID=28214 RepID=UPI001AC49E47|nr:alpha,alpha-trehalase TreF [Sphingomonas sp.]MBN8807102.1 alpha,alpha-trehalase TreF [Sphingomonas sp.]
MNDRSPLPLDASPPGPDELFGDLFVKVQTRRLFADGKTFPDMEPRRDPASIMTAWQAERPDTEDAIRSFVMAHFASPPPPRLDPPDHQATIGDHIAALWDDLVVTGQARGPWSSALALPSPYVIPGGRFREIYYWDSYFTMLGLAIDGRDALVESMLDNFVSLIERFGHIPNGTRSYFLSRSQPPFLALMTDLSRDPAPDVHRRRLAALRREHAYWMAGETALTASGSAAHVVRLPCGTILNRYWDASDTPRPESYAEDVAVAADVRRPSGEVYRDLRAAAESGWDFSSRWLRDPADLGSIETTAIVPIDLNCLLYLSERHIAAECDALGDAQGAATFTARADRRAAAIERYCWIENEGRFGDWHWIDARPVAGATAATLYPLFAGIATGDQAAATATMVERDLLAPGGLRTTTVVTTQQWDRPNGWAPLQWIAVAGLRRYGHDELADMIADRWLATVEGFYDETGALFEKYDIEHGRPAGGGEYPNQQGFGWTNGVVKALIDDRAKRRG